MKSRTPFARVGRALVRRLTAPGEPHAPAVRPRWRPHPRGVQRRRSVDTTLPVRMHPPL